jgi:DNA-binding MarR family transcriptional regulator
MQYFDLTNQNKYPRLRFVLDPAVAAILDSHRRLVAACGRKPGARPAARRSLSRHQALVLGQLDAERPIAIGELARQLRVTPATMTLAVDRLARLRCLRRVRDTGDRRRVLVKITAVGEAMRATFSELDPERVRAILARLSPADQAATLAACRALARAAAADPPPATPRGTP